MSTISMSCLVAIRARLHLSNVARPPRRYAHDLCTWPMKPLDVPKDANLQTQITCLLLTYAAVMETQN